MVRPEQIGRTGSPHDAPGKKIAGSPARAGRPRYRRRLLRVGPRRGALAQVQVAAPLEDDVDTGLVESAGAQLEQQLRGVLPVSARDLQAAGPDILREDG